MTQSTAYPLLVFGDDGAEASDRAWQWIAAHPWPGWRVDVLTADVDETHVEWGKPVQLEEWSSPWNRDPADVAADRVRFLTGAIDPRALLADVEADLMVLGIKSAGHLEALAMGSTTEWLLHHPPSPLAIVRRTAPVHKVMVCADGSAHAARAMEVFASLPLSPDTDVTVVSVDDGRTDTSAADRAAEFLEPIVASVSVSTPSGKPTDAILEAAQSTGADLLVLGTRGLTGWRRLRLGSTAAAVVRSVACDSLVACEEELSS